MDTHHLQPSRHPVDSAATSASNSMARATARSPAKEIAPFLKNLRRLLDNQVHAAIIRWTPDGRAFEIHDLAAMASDVLPKYFKHAKYTSFQRQLNYFNFRKWTRSQTTVCTFGNPHFQRDAPDLAWRITRKKSIPMVAPAPPPPPQQTADKMSIVVPSSPLPLARHASFSSSSSLEDSGGFKSPTDASSMVAQTFNYGCFPSSSASSAATISGIDGGSAMAHAQPLPYLCQQPHYQYQYRYPSDPQPQYPSHGGYGSPVAVADSTHSQPPPLPVADVHTSLDWIDTLYPSLDFLSRMTTDFHSTFRDN